jgi:hypothetical protein
MKHLDTVMPSFEQEPNTGRINNDTEEKITGILFIKHMHHDQFEPIFLEPLRGIHEQRLSHLPPSCSSQHVSTCQHDADILSQAVDVASQPLALFRGPHLVLLKLHLKTLSTMSCKGRLPAHDNQVLV